MSQLSSMTLELENGSRFEGFSFGYHAPAAGEAVFNTAMNGYPESLTDPSYRGQILIATYPLIGNYGVPADTIIDGLSAFFESEQIHISGLVIADYSFEYSHWNAQRSLGEWLQQHRIPAMYGVDTRSLAQLIRESGAMKARLVTSDQTVDWDDPNQRNLVAEVSIPEPVVYGTGRHRIMLVDTGVKTNILRCLLRRDTTVIRVPWNYDFTGEEFDGLFLTNGPGDPRQCERTITHLKVALERDKPIFGICLGSQLMALAAGAETYKLKYGHRGHNQPVRLAGTNRCFITSQNHGFAVDTDSLPAQWTPLFSNINDGSCEGIRHTEKPFFSVQFHPEAAGGPADTEFLFDHFIRCIGEPGIFSFTNQ
ncbi:MAG: carbamoyl-phosphate synthase (glutamine-hydrolyzing) small subunit [Bacteroidetes bacterium HGW-Bacteroidetes-22]|nr:MAG: carbamoyl-phosphate synthase (glutamine-hydrolyzing) small subunit [Bacteroidetes bacterium HGW-Bacteroidetes-22]